MKLKILSVAIVSCLSAADISMEIVKKVQQPLNDIIYTIQLASFLDKDGAIKTFEELPEDIKADSVLYKVGNYYTVRYKASLNRSDLVQDVLNIRQRTSYKDSIILKTSAQRLEDAKKGLLSSGVAKVSDQPNHYTKPKDKIMNSYDYTRALSEANDLIRDKDFVSGAEKYEMLFEHTKTNDLINNNLYYLYGKTLNWENAQKNLKYIEQKEQVLYAYGVGSIESHNPNLEEELKSWLMYDKKGYLNLILGVHKERQMEQEQAYSYYANAYAINRYDMYLAYAYARASEMVDLPDDAKMLYRYIYQNTQSDNLQIRQNAYNRLVQLLETN